MESKTVSILTKSEVKTMEIKLDVATREHVIKIDGIIKALSTELDAIKDKAKKTFGENGGNGVFSTETRESYILNTDELIELIGKEKFENLKNKLSKKTYVHW